MDDDIPTRLPVPYVRQPEMQRHERSWTLIAGSRRLSITRVDHYAVSRPMRPVVHPAPDRRWSLMGAVAVVLGSVAGVATLGLAMNASRAATGHYLLSVAVPERTPFHGVRPQPAPIRAVRPTPIMPAPVLLPTPEAITTVDEDATSFATSAPARLEAMQPAIDAAMTTGAMQQWTSSDGAERGFVVAGPVEQGCRTLSILTRRDGSSEVGTRRECAGTAAPATRP
jgi:hypothetical protein